MINVWPQLDFDFATEISALQDRLATCQQQKIELESRTETLLKTGAGLPNNLNLVVSRVKTRLAVAESDSRQLDSLLDMTSSLADDVSGKVRQLDLCKSRIVECLQRVEDALDLRFCTEGIKSAMANEDFEQAAGHVHRFLSLDKSIFGSSVVNCNDKDTIEIAKDAETFEQQFAIMKQAEVELRKILFTKFDEALNSGDVASIQRFFKLFPSLNQHETGLRKFGDYLKSKICEIASKDCIVEIDDAKIYQSRASVQFADTLTLLLENVARIFEIHQPLVENYYGGEYLLPFADILQEQVDVESCKILDTFVKARQYNAKAKLIDTYARQSSKYEHKEKIDPLELDHLLSEVTLLQTRCELYFRFIKRRVTNGIQKMSQHESRDKKSIDIDKAGKLQTLEKMLRDCRLNCRMQVLIGLYIAMEQYYTRETLRKAVTLNESESKVKSEHGPMTSSLVDDAFYVVRKSVKRAMSSSNVDCLCAVVNNACALLETDFLNLFQQKIKAGYPASGSLAEAYTTAAAAYISVVQQGKITSAAAADGADKARDDFLTALNDADNAGQSSRALLELLRVENAAFECQEKQQKITKIDGCLEQLSETASKFDRAATKGVQKLIEVVGKPRVKLIAERLADHGHVIDENQFDEYEAIDTFVEHFVTALDALLNQYKFFLTEANARRFFDFTIDESCKFLERCALRCEFNRLGALLFDKRVREISAYYADIGGGYETREKFARLAQIASILNVDNVAEAREFYQSPTITWRLSAVEVQKILTIRLDLPLEEVRKLKL